MTPEQQLEIVEDAITQRCRTYPYQQDSTRDSLIALRDYLYNQVRGEPAKCQMFRLQEAYQNPDGSMSEPHWDDWCLYDEQSEILQDELDDHLRQVGQWTEVFHNPEDDERPGFRRVAEIKA